jgi:uncharacterized membrane protein
MDLGYVVIAIFVGLGAMIYWSSRNRWQKRPGDDSHNPMPGHRLEGSDHTGGGMD